MNDVYCYGLTCRVCVRTPPTEMEYLSQKFAELNKEAKPLKKECFFNVIIDFVFQGCFEPRFNCGLWCYVLTLQGFMMILTILTINARHEF